MYSMKKGRNYNAVQLLCLVTVTLNKGTLQQSTWIYKYYYAERVRVSSKEPQFALFNSLFSIENNMFGVAYCHTVGEVFLRLCDNLLDNYKTDSRCKISVYNGLIYQLLSTRPYLKRNIINCSNDERQLYTKR